MKVGPKSSLRPFLHRALQFIGGEYTGLFTDTEKLRHRMMFKNKTLPWKVPKPNFVTFFLLNGMAFYFISKIEPCSNFPETRTPFVTSVCSHASQEYPRIFLNRVPIRARKKHYSLVWYMLMCVIFSIWHPTLPYVAWQ